MTLIIGCGNELMGDDWLGIYIIEKLKNKKIKNCKFTIAGTNSFNILWDLLGNDKVIIIDTIQSNNIPGQIYKLDYKELPQFINKDTFSSHDCSWTEILTIGTSLYRKEFPSKLCFLLIEIQSIMPKYRKLSPYISHNEKFILEKINKVIEAF